MTSRLVRWPSASIQSYHSDFSLSVVEPLVNAVYAVLRVHLVLCWTWSGQWRREVRKACDRTRALKVAHYVG